MSGACWWVLRMPGLTGRLELALVHRPVSGASGYRRPRLRHGSGSSHGESARREPVRASSLSLRIFRALVCAVLRTTGGPSIENPRPGTALFRIFHRATPCPIFYTSGRAAPAPPPRRWIGPCPRESGLAICSYPEALGPCFQFLTAHERRHLWQAWQVRNCDSFPPARARKPNPQLTPLSARCGILACGWDRSRGIGLLACAVTGPVEMPRSESDAHQH